MAEFNRFSSNSGGYRSVVKKSKAAVLLHFWPLKKKSYANTGQIIIGSMFINSCLNLYSSNKKSLKKKNQPKKLYFYLVRAAVLTAAHHLRSNCLKFTKPRKMVCSIFVQAVR